MDIIKIKMITRPLKILIQTKKFNLNFNKLVDTFYLIRFSYVFSIYLKSVKNTIQKMSSFLK